MPLRKLDYKSQRTQLHLISSVNMAKFNTVMLNKRYIDYSIKIKHEYKLYINPSLHNPHHTNLKLVKCIIIIII